MILLAGIPSESPLAFLAGLVCLVLFNGVLRVNTIDNHYGYFSKASEAFLAHLPPPPPGLASFAQFPCCRALRTLSGATAAGVAGRLRGRPA